MSFPKPVLTLLFTLVLVVSGYLRVLQTSNFNFPLTYDQGRDLLDLRVLAGFHDFKISGPTTSITGLNLGPYYYLFNLPPFWLSAGNPQALVVWNIIWFLLAGLAIFLFFLKSNPILGFLFSTTFLFSPQLFPITQYFWNAHSVVYVAVFYFLALWNYLSLSNQRNTIFLALFSGLIVQFEAAFGSFCLFYALLAVVFSKNLRKLPLFFTFSLPWFLPQLVYEITHHFQMSRLFLGIFTGKNPILGQSMSLEQAFRSHLNSIIGLFEGQFMLPYGGGLILFFIIITVIFLVARRRSIIYLLLFPVFAIFYYTLIYHHPLKSWYLDGFRVWFCLIFALSLTNLATKYKPVLLILTLFLIYSFSLTIKDQLGVYRQNLASLDPKNTAHQLAAIRWAYENLSGKSFSAYNFVPEIYDFPSQYLYWWYAKSQNIISPNLVSYSFKTVPDYVRLPAKFIPNNGSPAPQIVLTYETKPGFQEWLAQFSSYCPHYKKEFPWSVTVEVRSLCPLLNEI